MPLALDNPETVTIGTIQITSFVCKVEPLAISIHYDRGVAMPDGSFRVIDAGTTQFDAESIQAVDGQGQVYAGVKDALYQLLQSRLGGGKIE